MRHYARARSAAHKGFTLIETLMVMVLLGIAAVTITKLSGNLFLGQAANNNVIVGAQLMQECAETVLAIRRKTGYTFVTTSACSNLGNYGGFGVPTVTLALTGDPSPPSPITACTAASSSCLVTITISTGGSNMTAITLNLANYQI